MERNGTLDHARLIAAFGIVFFHAHAPGAAVGYTALPFFLILLVVMAVPAATRTSFFAYTRMRTRRLLVPWLIWSGVYGALKLAETAVTGASMTSEFAPYMILTGPALHLWFLPFAFVICVFAYPIMRAATAPLRGVLLAAGIGFLLLQQEQSLPVPLTQWLYGMPAVCLGLGLALGNRPLPRQVLLLGGFVACALVLGATTGLGQLILAATAFILCLALPMPSTAISRLAGTASLGVYLVHPIVLSVLERATPIPPHSLSAALLGCTGALAISLCIIWSMNVYGRKRIHLRSAQPSNTIL